MSTERRKTYETWRDMHRRCKDPKNKGYPNYGGRGIAVCERWGVFENFLTDMGYRPDKLTIERLDVNQGYDPFNCVWATKLENNRNTRKSIAKRERELQNPKQEQWEKDFIRDNQKISKPEYIPQTPIHGSKKMYLKHKCRCEICQNAMRERWRKKAGNRTPEAREKRAAWLREYRRKQRNR